jgi:hypothetical protein
MLRSIAVTAFDMNRAIDAVRRIESAGIIAAAAVIGLVIEAM